MATVSSARSLVKSTSRARRYAARLAKCNAAARACRVAAGKAVARRKAGRFLLAIFQSDGRGVITDIGVSRRAANQAILEVGPIAGWSPKVLPMVGKLRDCRPFDVLHGSGRNMRVERAATAHSLAV